MSGGLQDPLPRDQWKREVNLWFSAALTSIQGAFLEIADGPSSKEVEKVLAEPQDETGRHFCQNQVSHDEIQLAMVEYLLTLCLENT